MNIRRAVIGWFGLALFACGGRTLDDGVYGVEGTNGSSSCAYAGRTYADGSLISGACVCFCSQGQIECEQGCSTPGGGASSGGASGSANGGYGAVSSGGAATAGNASGGTSAAGTAGASGGVAGTLATGGSYGTAGTVTAGMGTAGSGTAGMGTGGAVSTCGVAPRAGSQLLIDDMEDGDQFILPHDGRSGIWYAYNDATGGFQFPQGQQFVMTWGVTDATGGNAVANTYGKGFSSWGAGMGFVFNQGCPYDASVERGLHFWARSEGGSAGIYVLLATSATTPTTNNGTCVPALATSCYDDYQTLINIDSSWSEWYVPYALLKQQGWGNAVKFDPRTLMGVNFQTLYGDGTAFSFSIDSVSFY